jgi:hypothetical protein
MGETMTMTPPMPPQNGACAGKPVEKWFPNLNVYEATHEELRTARTNMREAINICGFCDIRIECLNYALQWERHGIWGGMNETQREALRRKSNIPFLRPSIQELGLGIGNGRAATH